MALGHGRTYLVGMAARSLIFTLRRPDWPAIGARWGPLIDRTKGVLARFALRAWPGWWRGACEDPAARARRRLAARPGLTQPARPQGKRLVGGTDTSACGSPYRPCPARLTTNPWEWPRRSV